MREAINIIRDTIKEDWRQALKEVLSMMAVGIMAILLFTAIMLAYNLPSDPPGIQSAEHQAEVARRVAR